ncbi:MAG: AarF/ABC1/UbiB kinase family protein, partial [Pseudomonadota bacterium]
EIAEIMARLRAEADHMPPRQLRDVLDAEWGRGWLGRFAKFDAHPIAAASIGQVHRARLKDGTELAIKVQYPGVRRSIDSDVSNVGALMRMAGVLPPGTDIAPLLEEARRQLHEEADYEREAGQLAAFHRLLAGDDAFTTPAPHDALTTQNVLAMGFVKGLAVERMAEAPQDVRDRITASLFRLMLREMFEFGLMQTDPNFANYRYDAETGRVVLLDFGAARAYPPDRVAAFRALLRAAHLDDVPAIDRAIEAVGYVSAGTATHHREAVVALVRMGAAPFRQPGPVDFARIEVTTALREAGMELGMDRDFADLAPMDALFLQRKVAGMYLLAKRLRARVDVDALVGPWL